MFARCAMNTPVRFMYHRINSPLRKPAISITQIMSSQFVGYAGKKDKMVNATTYVDEILLYV